MSHCQIPGLPSGQSEQSERGRQMVSLFPRPTLLGSRSLRWCSGSYVHGTRACIPARPLHDISSSQHSRTAPAPSKSLGTQDSDNVFKTPGLS